MKNRVIISVFIIGLSVINLSSLYTKDVKNINLSLLFLKANANDESSGGDDDCSQRLLYYDANLQTCGDNLHPNWLFGYETRSVECVGSQGECVAGTESWSYSCDGTVVGSDGMDWTSCN